MDELSYETLNHSVDVWRITHDELDHVLQRIVTMGLSVKARFALVFALEDSDLKDNAAPKLGRL
jgi:hypothetical protein